VAKRSVLAFARADAAAVASADVEPVTLAVTLLDYGRLSPGIRASAEEQLLRIFAAADVEIRWVPLGHAGTNERRAIDVVLLSDVMARRLIKERAIPPIVLGITGPDTRRVYVFVDRVLHLAVQTGSDPGDTLGSVLAHELGHLLLPDNGHSRTGIMQAEYEMFGRGARRFTPAQAEAIRAFLREGHDSNAGR
jgi:hypothetical protein